MQGFRTFRSGLVAALLAISSPAAATAAVPDAPPRPVVGIPGGPHRLAAQGSYCWERREGIGLCADTIDPMSYAPTLRLPRGSDAIVRMGYPVTSLGATVDGEDARLEPLGDRARKFRLDLPEVPSRGKLELYLFANYDRGDGYFAMKLASRGR